MSKVIRYYLVPQSPWAYLGHQRLVEIAHRHGATVEPRPFDLGGQVFPISGGLPLGKRAPQRQAYRLVELARWSKFTGVALNVRPRFFPVGGEAASRLIIAATQAGGNQAGMTMAGALLAGVWRDERNIDDLDTVRQICSECGFDGHALLAGLEATAALYAQYTQDAIEAQVFGVPWYEYRGEPFWGQDRLDFLDRALSQ